MDLGNDSFTVDYGAAPGYGSSITSYTVNCGSASTTVSGSVLSATLSGLSDADSYECYLFASDSKGSGPYVQWTAQPGPPKAPTITSVLPQDGQLTVEFGPLDLYPITIDYTATCGTQSATVNGDVYPQSPSPNLWATVTGLTDGTSYSCTVLASDAAGSGPPSVAVAGTPNANTSSATSSAGGVFTAVSCPSPSECVAVGGGGPSSNGAGLVEVSTDGGEAFTDEPVPAGISPLSDVTCPDPLDCIAVGASTILVTTDGGTSWRTAFANAALATVSCVSDSVCVAGNDGYAVVTTDGGLTWQDSTGHPPPLYGLSCTRTICVGFGDGSALLSTDDGVTWQNFYLPQVQENWVVTSVACLPSTTTCFMVGYPAASLMTTDGQDWAKVASNFPAFGTTDVTCPTSDTCYGLGASTTTVGALDGATTANGGQAWALISGPTGFSSFTNQGLSCGSASMCIEVGGNSSGPAAAFTADGATSWKGSTIGNRSEQIGRLGSAPGSRPEDL